MSSSKSKTNTQYLSFYQKIYIFLPWWKNKNLKNRENNAVIQVLVAFQYWVVGEWASCLLAWTCFTLNPKGFIFTSPRKKPAHLQPSTYTLESHQGLVCARGAPNRNINYHVLNHIADAQTSSVSSGPLAELSFAPQLKDCTVLWNSAQPLQSTRAALVYTPPHAVQYMFTTIIFILLLF